MNKQIQEKLNVTLEDYIKWCKDNKLPIHSKKSKQLFYNKLLNKKLVKNIMTNELEVK